MRGWAQWTGEVKTGSLKDITGEAKMVITIDLSDDKQRHQGIVALEGDTIAQALRNYMAQSEQLDTHLWLAADGERAAGMLLQRLPEREQQDEDAWRRAVHLGKTITRNELLDLPAREIVHRLYHEEDIRIFNRTPVSFRCSCSRNRVGDVLRMLGHDEISGILHNHGLINVECEFCGQNYEFDHIDAEQLFAASVVAKAEPTRH
jgi:molecular chaperone Hsp33